MTGHVYGRYSREDALCQSNGYFSLNLRPAAVERIVELLQLRRGASVAWVGCGDGRELLSVARRHPDAVFDAFEINGCALDVARRVARVEGVTNVTFHHEDFLRAARRPLYTHVYSTAVAGPQLYAQLAQACSGRLCVLREMWVGGTDATELQTATVRLMGSGEQRQLVCGAVQTNAG